MSNGEAVYGFFIPTVSLMGIGSHKEIAAQMKSLGVSKPFLVADKGITAAGLTKQICDMIKADMGVDAVVYDETVPNPTDTNVAEGVALYEKSGCDMIITLGGGSSHDCGKGIGLVATNGGTIHDYEGVDQSTKAMPPFIAINTTAGPGSEMT
ncbi:MAG: iron-containing alcohol dehydrogenase, partial [Desulfobacteraceae bacterium]|nr:iron-containing alcohol dehydrogenase [Desulfobacteraceae bacterium]